MLKQVLICTAIVTTLMVNPVIAQQNLQTMPFGTPIGKEAVKKMAADAGTRPTGLHAGTTPTSIRLTWNCPQGAAGYEVYATPKGGAPIKLTQAPLSLQCYQNLSLSILNDPRLPKLTQAPTQTSYMTSFTHVGLAPAAEFAYVVRALYPNSFADSEPLNARALWPAPTGFVASLLGRSASLRWNSIGGPSGYLIFRKLERQAGFHQVVATPIAATSHLDNTNLPPGQHAYYVQGVNGEPSVVASVLLGARPAPAPAPAPPAPYTYGPQDIAPPAGGGYAIRVSTSNLAGSQLDASRLVNASLGEISNIASVERFGRADPSPTVVVFVSSNVAPAAMPKRVNLAGNVRTICEGFRGAQGLPGTYTETNSAIYEDNIAPAASWALSLSKTFSPSSYPCSSGLLRRIEVEVQGTAFQSNGTVIVRTPLVRLTMVARIKLMSFNIQGGYHRGGGATVNQTMTWIGDLIKAEHVDAAVLQEVHVNFQSKSNYLNEMSILRSALAPTGLTSDAYQTQCPSPTGTDGQAIFSRFPMQSTSFLQLGTAQTHCWGDLFATATQIFGVQSMTVQFGSFAQALVFGNTHYPSAVPGGYQDGVTAGLAYGSNNSAAMRNSPFTYLMSGDYNAGDGSGAFVGMLGNNQGPVHVVNASEPEGVNRVNVPPLPANQGGWDFIDHMFYKSSSSLVLAPIETYFRYWGHLPTIYPALSDHIPRLTTYEIR